jgi:hypothetical protein
VNQFSTNVKISCADQLLLNQSQLEQLRSPEPYDTQVLRDWLAHPRGSRSELRGPGSLIYQTLPEHDLLSISPSNGFLIKTFEKRLDWLLPHLPKKWFTVSFDHIFLLSRSFFLF